MTISYKWLSEYLPEKIEPSKLSEILTSIGLEVESLEKFERVKGGLEGVVTGKVIELIQHPDADKLKLAKVDIGTEILNIVCGAANIAAGQNVLVATIGTTIYPSNGSPVTMKAARIRGIESNGMICAEDELGLGNSHDGIMVLPGDVKPGTKASEYFQLYEDWIFEIGLTPNRMDAMSHLGVAKDVCAWLTYHGDVECKTKTPFTDSFKADNTSLPVEVKIDNPLLCKRYAGVTVSGVSASESPAWLKNKLVSIGLKPVNNIVDITNFILHETGQPLHAFDADAIEENRIIVRNANEGESFITLDGKERKLNAEDILISNPSEGMCLAGVFGGAKSGITSSTKNIFIESAWFNPGYIRKTSLRHGLRTDAATRFEKGVDISNVVNVLKRAAIIVKEIAGGEISSEIIDIYPDPVNKTEVILKYEYLKKLSGKNYQPGAVKKILTGLGFEMIQEDADAIRVAVPFSKTDISLPADIVEEILRIDGLDNIEVSGAITITPGIDENNQNEKLKEKISGFLLGLGFSEIITNSITNSSYYSGNELNTSVKMLNSLSADLDVMRPSMIESGLEVISYNINRKAKDLKLFDFGKTYSASEVGNYIETEHLMLYVTGNSNNISWKEKEEKADFYMAKGIAGAVMKLCGLGEVKFNMVSKEHLAPAINVISGKKEIVAIGEVSKERLKTFDIKQPVYIIDFMWSEIVSQAGQSIFYSEVPKFPLVQRDLALVLDKRVTYNQVENVVKKLNLDALQQMNLFDIFESEKLGKDKKSLAVNFTFSNQEKTLTDKETDAMMDKLIKAFEKEISAEIRK